MTRCEQRNHQWAENPPSPGVPCVLCEKRFGERAERSRKPPAAPASDEPPPLSEADVVALFAPSGPSPPSASPSSAMVASSPAEPPASSPSWCRHAGRTLATLFVTACEAAIERMRRIPNEPDDDDVEELGVALGEQLAVWFPNSELTPFKKCIIAGGAVAGTMIMGAKKMPPEIPDVVAATGAPPPSAPSADATPAAKSAPTKPPAPRVPAALFGGA